jgi:hypothetical protein
MHAASQLRQPQHDELAHSSQNEKPSHGASGEHVGAQTPWDQRQVKPGGHGSSSSQRPRCVGRQAARQSSHLGQLDVAQGSQKVLGAHESHAPGSHAAAHSPRKKMQTPPGQSSWEEHGPGPVVTPVVVDGADVAVVVEAPEPPEPPAPCSTTARPPQAGTSARIARIQREEDMMPTTVTRRAVRLARRRAA